MRSVRIAAVLCFFKILVASESDASVFENSSFAFRVELSSNWVPDQETDSAYYFKDVNQGKKTRLHLKRYILDTTYNFNTNEWSQLSFAINKEFAQKTGKIIYSDTSVSIKLGEFRAYELFAFYSQNVDNKNVWWAEYCRWTDVNGLGYFVSIIGDTAEMKTNFSVYESIMNLIVVNPSAVKMRVYTAERHATVPVSAVYSPGMVDLMGRAVATGSFKFYSGIMVNLDGKMRRVYFNCKK
ncbi:MAG TPA: hypothetical protein VHP36_04590 [Chitinispirillaceae bacterium]|nr:hypothetical protein [Chitinispirillaceae bacterium]